MRRVLLYTALCSIVALLHTAIGSADEARAAEYILKEGLRVTLPDEWEDESRGSKRPNGLTFSHKKVLAYLGVGGRACPDNGKLARFLARRKASADGVHDEALLRFLLQKYGLTLKQNIDEEGIFASQRLVAGKKAACLSWNAVKQRLPMQVHTFIIPVEDTCFALHVSYAAFQEDQALPLLEEALQGLEFKTLSR